MPSIKRITLDFGRETMAANITLTNGDRCQVTSISVGDVEHIVSETEALSGEPFERHCMHVVRGIMSGIVGAITEDEHESPAR